MGHSEHLDTDLHPEMKNFQKEKFDAEVLAQCSGRQECTAELNSDLFALPKSEQSYD